MAIQKPWYDAWIDDDGSGTTGTIWNKAELVKLINGLDPSMHGVSCYAPAAVALANGWNIPNLYGLEFDVPAGHMPTPGTIQIPAGGGGLYLVAFTIRFQTGTANGLRIGQVNLASAALIEAETVASATIHTTLTAYAFANLITGHQLTMNVFTTEATQLLVNSRFSVVRI